MMTPSREATVALYLTSAFSAQCADGAILSTILSFDPLILLGIGNRPIAIGGEKKEIATHFNKSNWSSCRQNSHTFAITMYTNANVITLPVKPLSLPLRLPPALSYDYVFLPVLSVREVCCCAD